MWITKAEIQVPWGFHDIVQKGLRIITNQFCYLSFSKSTTVINEPRYFITFAHLFKGLIQAEISIKNKYEWQIHRISAIKPPFHQ